MNHRQLQRVAAVIAELQSIAEDINRTQDGELTEEWHAEIGAMFAAQRVLMIPGYEHQLKATIWKCPLCGHREMQPLQAFQARRGCKTCGRQFEVTP